MGVNYNPKIVTDGLVLALDPSNKKSYSQNEFKDSTDIFAWCGSTGHSASIISRDNISSPVGNTPLRMQVTGNDPHITTYNSATWNIAPALNGQTWVISVYVKANVTTTGELVIFGANSSGTSFVGGGWLSISGVTVNIGTEWSRVNHYITMNNPNISFIHVRLDGPNTGGAGQTVWWDGLQVERVAPGTTTPTPFTSTYYGGSVYKDLVGSNNGTLVNYPTYSDANGGSLSFDGVNDYVSLTSTDLRFGGSNSYTFDFFIKVPHSTSNQTIFSNGNLSTNGIWFFKRRSGLDNKLTFHGYSTNPRIDLLSTNIIPDNNFCSVSLTFNGVDTYSVYINGQFENSITTNSIVAATGNSFIGATNGTGSFFGGNIYSTKIYNRALTASEIQQNFNAIKGRYNI